MFDIFFYSHEIHFILSDWNVPDGTGLDLLKEVRSRKHLAPIPILMVTAEDSISYMLEAIEEGVNEYLIKPWTPEEFDEKIQSAWDNAK